MSKLRFAPIFVLLTAVGLTSTLPVLGLAPAAYAADEAEQPKGETVRAEVGVPLQAAQELIKQQKYKEALAKIAETDAVPNKTPWETFTIDHMRGAAAARAGDTEQAGKSFEAVIASGRLSPAEQAKVVQALGNMYYDAKNYPKAIAWLTRSLKEGGADPQTRTLLIQSYYLSNDIPRATSELQSAIAADESAGRAPSEIELKLLASCALKSNDKDGYQVALEKLNTYYPKKDYWLDLIGRVQNKPGFSDRLVLDLYRLKAATVQLQTSSEFTDMAQLSLLAGFPAEAKKTLDQGYQSGLLGSGPDAAKQKRLQDQAGKAASDDLKSMAQSETAAVNAKEGTGQVNLGYALVTAGQFDKGLRLMEDGLKKGNLKRSDDAKLHLGIAYQLAGQKDKAIEAFKSVKGTDGAADLARLWVMQVNHPLN
ncbi:TPR repeat family protein [Collimonas arenae]|uniref:TPR repeat family protein n=1 Tax=Collimonas arenae TaxID=279058 RepID=A0A127QGC4_9BURK|nr:tetratricopeptide repeat protein [Collimonas arenae]AMO99126.1 TPR repeat family protein [Collimonas arenae]AMP09026.1 TPR repeat family protein [Collimonas arenae]